MKKAIFILLYFAAMLTAVAQYPSCDGNRYRTYVFPAYDSVINIQYGHNFTQGGASQNLIMDIYTPHGDVATKRPMILFIHGGGFVGGSRQDMRTICLLYALQGYVTATIDYRLVDIPATDSTIVATGMVQAVSDAKAAVRYFTQDAATSNLYKVDTNFIFIAGLSAGAITSLHAAYMDASDNIPPYLLTIINNNGGFKGNSSTNTAHTTPIKAVLSYSGALYQKEFISPGEPALFSFHDIGDTIVPCGHGHSSLFPSAIYLDGACALQPEATSKGVYNDLFIHYSSGHGDYFYYPTLDTVLQKTSNFLYEIICDNLLSVNSVEKEETSFQLYPNPATEKITISYTGNTNKKEKFRLLNAMGMLVKEMEVNETTEISIAGLPTGLYFVQRQNNPKQTLKFIKQ